MAACAVPRAGLAASHQEVLGPWFVEIRFGPLEGRNVAPEARVVSSPQAGDSWEFGRFPPSGCSRLRSAVFGSGRGILGAGPASPHAEAVALFRTD